jgi:hypothetical protein
MHGSRASWLPLYLNKTPDYAIAKPPYGLFLHSTFVREEHPGRRLTLSAIGLYVGRVVARAAAKLPH